MAFFFIGIAQPALSSCNRMRIEVMFPGYIHVIPDDSRWFLRFRQTTFVLASLPV
jgi:hypothetical protein